MLDPRHLVDFVPEIMALKVRGDDEDNDSRGRAPNLPLNYVTTPPTVSSGNGSVFGDALSRESTFDADVNASFTPSVAQSRSSARSSATSRHRKAHPWEQAGGVDSLLDENSQQRTKRRQWGDSVELSVDVPPQRQESAASIHTAPEARNRNASRSSALSTHSTQSRTRYSAGAARRQGGEVRSEGSALTTTDPEKPRNNTYFTSTTQVNPVTRASVLSSLLGFAPEPELEKTFYRQSGDFDVVPEKPSTLSSLFRLQEEEVLDDFDRHKVVQGIEIARKTNKPKQKTAYEIDAPRVNTMLVEPDLGVKGVGNENWRNVKVGQALEDSSESYSDSSNSLDSLDELFHPELVEKHFEKHFEKHSVPIFQESIASLGASAADLDEEAALLETAKEIQAEAEEQLDNLDHAEAVINTFNDILEQAEMAQQRIDEAMQESLPSLQSVGSLIEDLSDDENGNDAFEEYVRDLMQTIDDALEPPKAKLTDLFQWSGKSNVDKVERSKHRGTDQSETRKMESKPKRASTADALFQLGVESKDDAAIESNRGACDWANFEESKNNLLENMAKAEGKQTDKVIVSKSTGPREQLKVTGASDTTLENSEPAKVSEVGDGALSIPKTLIAEEAGNREHSNDRNLMLNGGSKRFSTTLEPIDEGKKVLSLFPSGAKQTVDQKPLPPVKKLVAEGDLKNGKRHPERKESLDKTSVSSGGSSFLSNSSSSRGLDVDDGRKPMAANGSKPRNGTKSNSKLKRVPKAGPRKVKPDLVTAFNNNASRTAEVDSIGTEPVSSDAVVDSVPERCLSISPGEVLLALGGGGHQTKSRAVKKNKKEHAQLVESETSLPSLTRSPNHSFRKIRTKKRVNRADPNEAATNVTVSSSKKKRSGDEMEHRASKQSDGTSKRASSAAAALDHPPSQPVLPSHHPPSQPVPSLEKRSRLPPNGTERSANVAYHAPSTTGEPHARRSSKVKAGRAFDDPYIATSAAVSKISQSSAPAEAIPSRRRTKPGDSIEVSPKPSPVRPRSKNGRTDGSASRLSRSPNSGTARASRGAPSSDDDNINISKPTFRKGPSRRTTSASPEAVKSSLHSSNTQVNVASTRIHERRTDGSASRRSRSLKDDTSRAARASRGSPSSDDDSININKPTFRKGPSRRATTASAKATESSQQSPDTQANAASTRSYQRKSKGRASSLPRSAKPSLPEKKQKPASTYRSERRAGDGVPKSDPPSLDKKSRRTRSTDRPKERCKKLSRSPV